VGLERQNIEKRDFPIGRRGYDPDAVDAHLSAIAGEVEELKSTARRRTETLASSASDQVRAIVEAAETTAADIQRQAEEDAQEIRGDASAEAQHVREQASDQAREYVGKVSESTAVMLQRLDAMESELGALIESLRTGANRLNADLQLLEGNLTELQDSAAPRPRFEAEDGGAWESTGGYGAAAPAEDVYAEQHATHEIDPGYADVSYEEPAGEEAEPAPDKTPTYEQPAAEGDEPGDTEGARLIALNMALNGTPREETDRYLAANFELGDRAALLDEVYASVEG
jgi:cell division septum initiation protein DivIVA